MIPPRCVLPAIFLLTVLALLPGIGEQAALTQSDEFRVSMATTLEMHRDGHFWVPHLDGVPRLQKPPLVYWLLFLTTSVLGPTLLAMRLPILLFAAGSACLTESLARRTGFDRVPAGSAGLLMAASLGVGILGRLALLEIPLLFFVLLAVVCWIRFEESEAGGWAIASLAALGLSALVKGPIGPLVGGAAIAGRIWLCGSASGLVGHGRSLALAGVVFGMVAGAWPLAMIAEHGSAFFEVVGDELFGKRFLRGGSGGALSVGGGLLLLTAPWTLFFLASLPGLFRAPDSRERREGRWLLLWVCAALLPFAFARSGFERYALPALPAATLLALRLFAAARGEGRLLRGLALATAATIASAGALLLWLFTHFGVGPIWAVAVCSVALGLFGFGLLGPARLRLAAVGFIGFQSVFFGSLYPALGINQLPEDLAREIGSRSIALYGSRPPAMLAMALGRPVPGIPPRPKAIRAIAAVDGWIAVSAEGRPSLEKRLRRLGYRWRVIREWQSLHTRKTALRAFRSDASEEDFRRAFETGSLDTLKEHFAILGDLEGPAT